MQTITIKANINIDFQNIQALDRADDELVETT